MQLNDVGGQAPPADGGDAGQLALFCRTSQAHVVDAPSHVIGAQMQHVVPYEHPIATGHAAPFTAPAWDAGHGAGEPASVGTYGEPPSGRRSPWFAGLPVEGPSGVNGHQKLTHLGQEELTHPGGPGRV